jgi:hypothetical protein
MQASVFECYFDDSDYEPKDISEMSLKQLVIYKKQLLELNSDSKLTEKQTELLNGKFSKAIWLEYPSTLTNASDEDAAQDLKMRKMEQKKFKEECIKINKLKFQESTEMLQKIELLEVELRANSEAKYKADQKIYANEKCTCECGMETIRKNKSTHKKSKSHLIYEAKLASVAAEEIKKKQVIEQRKQMAARKNNGYDLDENRKIIFPIDAEGNRYYLKDAEGKNMYPIDKQDGLPIYMKDANGFTITPKETQFPLF